MAEKKSTAKAKDEDGTGPVGTLVSDVGQAAGSGHPEADESGNPPGEARNLMVMRHAGATEDVIATIPLAEGAKVTVEKIKMGVDDSYVVHVTQSSKDPQELEQRAQSLATGRVSQPGFEE
jgi:hypothetical protein